MFPYKNKVRYLRAQAGIVGEAVIQFLLPVEHHLPKGLHIGHSGKLVYQESYKHHMGALQDYPGQYEVFVQDHAIGDANNFCICHCGPCPSCNKVVIFTFGAQCLPN